ncbi:MAG TPA: adenylate kinase [Jiangellales bacterium]|nr:adenylate kinase [Jiangellales bacterium]
MRLLLIGAPGSGKGTQATAIADHFGFAHISSGELLRQHIADETPIGRIAGEFVARGDLVPDGVIMDVLRRPVETASRNGGYVLDGFPRSVAQAEAAYLVAKDLDAWVQVAVYLKVPHDMLIERMRRRGQSAGRSDDSESVMRHRIEVFEELTPPLLDYYARREIVIYVDGSRSIGEVSAAVIAELDRVRGTLADHPLWIDRQYEPTSSGTLASENDGS